MATQRQRMTCRQVILRAFQFSGIKMPTEQPDGFDTQLALDSLNLLVGQWRNEELWQYGIQSLEFAVTTGKREYTIGYQGDLPTAPDWPTNYPIIEIREARVKVGGQTWQPLREISIDDFYRTTATPTANRLPYVFAFNRTEPYGVFHLLNGPDQGYPVQIIIATAMPFYSLDDEIELPAGYLNAFILNLGVVLGDTYLAGRGTSPEFRDRAQKAIDAIKAVNFKPELLTLDVGPLRYNIYSDSYVQIGRGGL
jgi:hypothetical protein